MIRLTISATDGRCQREKHRVGTGAASVEAGYIQERAPLHHDRNEPLKKPSSVALQHERHSLPCG